MQYEPMVRGIFRARPNRFIAHVDFGTGDTVCHVKNTGRCRELLVPGTTVWCKHSSDTKRKTAYDLITVQKGDRLINMDSQAPNTAAEEWLRAGGLGEVCDVRREVFYGESRYDLAFIKNGRPCLMEVKGVTLEHDGVCAFPDAPTQRGARHLRGLAQAVRDGYEAYALFVIQMEDVLYLHPNDATDPDFGRALREAAAAGVQILAMDCAVTESTMALRRAVPVRL